MWVCKNDTVRCNLFGIKCEIVLTVARQLISKYYTHSKYYNMIIEGAVEMSYTIVYYYVLYLYIVRIHVPMCIV